MDSFQLRIEMTEERVKSYGFCSRCGGAVPGYQASTDPPEEDPASPCDLAGRAAPGCGHSSVYSCAECGGSWHALSFEHTGMTLWGCGHFMPLCVAFCGACGCREPDFVVEFVEPDWKEPTSLGPVEKVSLLVPVPSAVIEDQSVVEVAFANGMKVAQMAGVRGNLVDVKIRHTERGVAALLRYDVRTEQDGGGRPVLVFRKPAARKERRGDGRGGAP